MRQQNDSLSITTIMRQHADVTYYPYIQELLKIPCAILVGSKRQKFYVYVIEIRNSRKNQVEK